MQADNSYLLYWENSIVLDRLNYDLLIISLGAMVGANARYLLFGISLILMAIYRPQGLWPSRRRSLELHPADIDQDSLYMDEKN